MARIYINDSALSALIFANFKKSAPTAEVQEWLNNAGYSAAPYRVNRLMGRFHKTFTPRATALTDNKRALLDAARTVPYAEQFDDQTLLNIIDQSWTTIGAMQKIQKFIAADHAKHATPRNARKPWAFPKAADFAPTETPILAGWDSVTA